MKKIALVTGANRGIGLEICRQLSKKNLLVILTSRNSDQGIAATQKLDKTGKSIIFHKLDVSDEDSIKDVNDFVNNKFGKLDILINNAGIYIDGNSSAYNVEPGLVRRTLDTNLMGPLLLCQALIPLMQKNNYGRIVNISSGMGAFKSLGSGYAAYRISKTALNALTKILASEMSGSNILVNSMCPDWVRTDMGGADATRSVEEGADTVVWLALNENNKVTGKFFRDRKEIEW
ncbi:SDR family oxidoreductase [Calditrichota bacterium]